LATKVEIIRGVEASGDKKPAIARHFNLLRSTLPMCYKEQGEVQASV